MPNLDCNESFYSLLGTSNPMGSPDFLNPDYNPSLLDSWDRGPYTLNFKYSGDDYDFSKSYIPETMYIRKVFGFEPGNCNFEIWDYGRESWNMPFQIPGNMEIEVENHNGTERYFRGRVQDVEPIHISRRPDGTENRRLKISCLDLKGDFNRWIYSETYPSGTTTYAVIKDAIQNHSPFDASLIDAAKGFVLDGYRVFEQTAAQVIQEMLDLEVTTTFKLDDNTLQVKLGLITDPEFNIFTVSENDVYEYFPDKKNLFISPQTQILRNSVIFWFNAAYSTGTIAVTEDGTTIIGTGTKWKTNLRTGAKIKIEGDTTEYSVVDVVDNTDITVSPAMVRGTASGLTYSASAYRDRIIVDDAENIATMAAILNEDFENAGVFMVKMPDRPNPLTREQARVVANAYLNRLTQNVIVRGRGVTNNALVKFRDMSDGDTITFDLERSRGVNSVLRINELILEHEKGGLLIRNDPNHIWYTDNADTRKDPYHKVTFVFTDRRLDNERQMERILQDLTDVKVTDDDIIEIIKKSMEIILLYDCNGVIKVAGTGDDPDKTIAPHGLFGDNAEEIELEDLLFITDYTPGVEYYTAPVDVGQTEAYTAATGIYAFAS